MKEGVIFIEKTFWEELASVRERYAISDKLIHSQSDIYTNYKKEEVSFDTFLGSIHEETGGRLYWDKNIDDYIESEDIVPLSSIYLTGLNSMLCDGKSIRHGIIVFNNCQFSGDKKVFSPPEAIEIDEDNMYESGWKNKRFEPLLSNNKCNSLIINDKYLCNKGYVNPDLKDILDMVLPKGLTIPFHLSIFSELRNGDTIYQEMKSILASIRTPDFCANTKFTLCYSTLHDRFIISNTFCITVGAGFALFNGGSSPVNSTSVKILYPTAVGNKREYYLWIRKTKEINERPQNVWGDRVNRLFDLVE